MYLTLTAACNNVPKDFYPAFADKASTINGLNERTLRASKDVNAAYQVIMDALLKTKGSKTIKGYKKVMPLSDLVNKNPSVFNPDGTLKPNADLSKLDVPTLNYMNQNYIIRDGIYTFSKHGYYKIERNNAVKYYKANGQEVTNLNLLVNNAPELIK